MQRLFLFFDVRNTMKELLRHRPLNVTTVWGGSVMNQNEAIKRLQVTISMQTY